APNNAVLVIAGDFDLAEARRLVAQYFGWLPRGPAVPPAPDLGVPSSVGRQVRVVVPDNVPLPRVYAAFRIPPLRERDGWYAADVLARILGDGRSSRLYGALVRDQQVASTVNAFTFGLLDGADLLVVTATAKPGVTADSLERAVLAEIERARVTPPAAEEMRRVVNRAQYQLADQLQTLGGFNGRADQLAQFTTFFGDPGEVNRVLDRFSAVKAEAVAGLARERLVEANRVMLIYVPRPQPPREASDE
ncbi:MAG: M16 family metallopeptidase, partial [Gemmatimonadales bacterium]